MHRALLVAGAAAAITLTAATAASAASSSAASGSAVGSAAVGSAAVAGVQIASANSEPNALNDHGDVVGDYTLNNQTRGFVWHGGKLSDLGVLGGNAADVTWPTAVNGSGEVVGHSGSSLTSFGYHAFLWRDGKLMDLGGLGGDSFAQQINDKGLIVGYADDASQNPVAVEWRDGTLATLPGLGGTASYAMFVNDAGLIAGESTDASGTAHAVVWVNGKVEDLGVGTPIALNDRGQVLVRSYPAVSVWDNGKTTTLPAGDQAAAMNDKGQVVGTITAADGSNPHGFVWQNGSQTDLGTEQGLAINDRGQILVTAADASGVFEYSVLDHGSLTTLDPTSGTYYNATLINDNGLVAGDTFSNSSATVWQLQKH
jgi:probable HAF family extracellular repeat protein